MLVFQAPGHTVKVPFDSAGKDALIAALTGGIQIARPGNGLTL